MAQASYTDKKLDRDNYRYVFLLSVLLTCQHGQNYQVVLVQSRTEKNSQTLILNNANVFGLLYLNSIWFIEIFTASPPSIGRFRNSQLVSVLSLSWSPFSKPIGHTTCFHFTESSRTRDSYLSANATATIRMFIVRKLCCFIQSSYRKVVIVYIFWLGDYLPLYQESQFLIRILWPLRIRIFSGKLFILCITG